MKNMKYSVSSKNNMICNVMLYNSNEIWNNGYDMSAIDNESDNVMACYCRKRGGMVSTLSLTMYDATAYAYRGVTVVFYDNGDVATWRCVTLFAGDISWRQTACCRDHRHLNNVTAWHRKRVWRSMLGNSDMGMRATNVAWYVVTAAVSRRVSMFEI